MQHLLILLIFLAQFGHASDHYYYQNNQKITLTPIKTLQRNMTNTDYYTNTKGHTLGVQDQLLVKLYNENSLEDVLHTFNLTHLKTLGTGLYLLKTPNKSSTIDIANQLTQKDEVKYAHPNFLKKRMKR